MLTLPNDRECLKEHVSNFDHEIPAGLSDELKNNYVFAEHCGWNFFGKIWFADGEFHEQVMRYCSHVATLSAPTLKELVEKVNDEYGYD